MHTLKDYYFLRFRGSFFRKVKDLKNWGYIFNDPQRRVLSLDPPPTWISRALDSPSHENFQRAIRRGGVDFFWNNPIAKNGHCVIGASWGDTIALHDRFQPMGAQQNLALYYNTGKW